MGLARYSESTSGELSKDVYSLRIRLKTSEKTFLRFLYRNLHRESRTRVCHMTMSNLLCNCNIMEYGSTPYVGMALEKNGLPIQCVQNDMLRTLL